MTHASDLLARIRSGSDESIIEALDELLPRWISVDESLPEQGQRVIAVLPVGYDLIPEVREMYYEDGEWSNDRGHWNVSHWMRLPEPPEVK
jgi:hypothetical protein